MYNNTPSGVGVNLFLWSIHVECGLVLALPPKAPWAPTAELYSPEGSGSCSCTLLVLGNWQVPITVWRSSQGCFNCSPGRNCHLMSCVTWGAAEVQQCHPSRNPSGSKPFPNWEFYRDIWLWLWPSNGGRCERIVPILSCFCSGFGTKAVTAWEGWVSLNQCSRGDHEEE